MNRIQRLAREVLSFNDYFNRYIEERFGRFMDIVTGALLIVGIQVLNPDTSKVIGAVPYWFAVLGIVTGTLGLLSWFFKLLMMLMKSSPTRNF